MVQGLSVEVLFQKWWNPQETFSRFCKLPRSLEEILWIPLFLVQFQAWADMEEQWALRSLFRQRGFHTAIGSLHKKEWEISQRLQGRWNKSSAYLLFWKRKLALSLLQRFGACNCRGIRTRHQNHWQRLSFCKLRWVLAYFWEFWYSWRDSTIGSMLPSMIFSMPCHDFSMRWSVTLSCGKL